MMLSDENIIVFQKLYKEHFGKDISKEDAYKQGTKFLRLMSLVYRPMTREEFQFAQERQAESLQRQR